MKRWQWMLTTALLCSPVLAGGCQAARAGAGAPRGQVVLRYTVSLRSPEDQRVTVTALLAGLDQQLPSLRWRMQRQFAFVRLPEPLLEGPVLATSGDEPLDLEHPSPYEWIVAPRGHASICLTYTVPLTHRTLEAVKKRDAYEYPYVADDHGLLVTPTLFMFPDDVTVSEMRVRFELPEGWPVIAPWRRVGEGEFDPGTTEALLNDLIAIGAWHVHEIRTGAFEGTIALAPGQDALEQAAVGPIRQIVEYELALFGRPAQGRYLFLFGRPETRGMAGSPKTNSMTLSVSPSLAPMAGQYLPHLIAHEFFHTWAAGMEMPDELRWVNEGFTDYYAYLVAARLGLSTWEQFAEMLAEKMQAAAANPLHGKLSLTAAGGEAFFHDSHAYDLAYDGGLLIAAWLDRSVRQHGRGQTLDDLMRAFINDPRWQGGGSAPTLEDFLAVARQFTSPSTAERLQELVTQPYSFEPRAEFAKLGIEIGQETSAPDLSLRANLESTRVIDLDQSGIAYRVGIRSGDRLVEINGQPVSNAQEVRSAWRSPIDKRIRVKLERDGQSVEIDEPLPNVERFTVPVQPWREHA